MLVADLRGALVEARLRSEDCGARGRVLVAREQHLDLHMANERLAFFDLAHLLDERHPLVRGPARLLWAPRAEETERELGEREAPNALRSIGVARGELPLADRLIVLAHEREDAC